MMNNNSNKGCVAVHLPLAVAAGLDIVTSAARGSRSITYGLVLTVQQQAVVQQRTMHL